MSKGEQKSESKTELPAWYVPYAKQGLQIGSKLAQQGYVPYQGPSVAAFSPQQKQGMQMANDWAAAFGGKGAKSADVSKQLMPEQTFAGGLKGFSSYGGYQEALDKLKKTSPGLYDYIKSFSVNPQTGAPAQQFDPKLNGLPSPAQPPAQPGGIVQQPQGPAPGTLEWWQLQQGGGRGGNR
jgi:hypothetical protein